MSEAETLISGGTLIDGSGAAPLPTDLVLRDGRIAEILPPGQLGDAANRIDASGCVITPGFIDIHSHSDFTLLADPRAVSAISQGVTLEVIGNCGFGCAPLGGPGPLEANIYGYRDIVPLSWRGTAGYFEALRNARPAINVAALIPNGKLRLSVVGTEERPANPDELHAMEHLLAEGFEAGAFGYSTGLEYGPERHCTEDEITALCRVVAKHGGYYATHTRNRPFQAEQAIAEAIRTARAAKVPLQISHISSVARLEHDGRAAIERALEQVELARREGQDVGFDMHTRSFGTTTLSAALPPWVVEGDRNTIAARLASADVRRAVHEMESIVVKLARGDWSRLTLLGCRANISYNGQTIAALAAANALDPLDMVIAILREEVDAIHSPMVAAFVYRDEDTRIVFTHDNCMVGSDATTLAPDGPLGDAIFHGAYTWAAWYLRHFAVETKQIPLTEAIYRITGLPARRLGLNDRGVVRLGAWADLAIFDPATFTERGTVAEPNRLATGMRYVFVNGVLTLRDGEPTGLRAGQVLQKA